MDLWIRSQDRKGLIEANNLYADEGRIVLISKIGGRVTIATYSSQKRALEVLDEIQKYLINNAFAKKTNGLGETLDIIPNPIFVYEMPDE